MALLQLLRGGVAGTEYVIRGERTVMGRHPNCQIVLQNGAVSRHHAQILESHGSYFIEDLRSRNGTFVNDDRVDGRRELREGDEIRVCDVAMLFLIHPSTAIPVSMGDAKKTVDLGATAGLIADSNFDESKIYLVQENEEDFPEEEFSSSTSIRRVTGDESDHKSTIAADIKLRAVLEITRALSKTLEVDQVLPKMMETLFNIFPRAEQGFVLLKDPETGKLKVKATRARGGGEADAVAVSMTVVRHAMQTGEAILSENVLGDARFNKSTALSKMRIRSMMCVPLVSQDESGLGVIQIVSRDQKHSFTEEDLDLLVTLASQASMAIENARFHEDDVERRELERDLEFATQVQLGFLPKSRPKLPGYEFADYYEAALRVGGDYFDYITLPDGRVAVAIGDVAGKGMPAALLMARLYSSTRFQLLTKPTLEQAVAGLNEEISSSGLGHRFITLLVMVIDPRNHQLAIVNAGHLTPVLRHQDGTVVQIGKEKSSLPLGIVPEMGYESMLYEIAPGDTIVGFTDGVTESMNDEREIFGRARLEAVITGSSGNAEATLEAVVNAAEGFTGPSAARDDTCIIAFRRLGTLLASDVTS